MIPRTREAAGSITDDGKTTRVSSSPSAATPWLKSKDPRIVRVSRAFGGKDRHSKVCTVRGLRDRRVRLSVPTALQLYDLQDRLGFNQPSKVVDWLLNEAKHEIDELPPLPGNFIQNYHSFLPSNQGNNWDDQTGLNFWNSSTLSRSKSKENLTKINEEENNNSSLQGMLNSVMPYGSCYHLEPSNLTFSQLGSHGITTQQEDQHLQSFNVLPLQPTLSLPSAASSTTEFDHPRHINHFHMLSSTFSISQSMRPFQLSKTLDGHIDSTNDDSPTQLHRES